MVVNFTDALHYKNWEAEFKYSSSGTSKPLTVLLQAFKLAYGNHWSFSLHACRSGASDKIFKTVPDPGQILNAQNLCPWW